MNTIKNALEKCRTYVAVQKFGCGHTGIGHGVEDNLLQLLNKAFEELARLEKREPTLMSDCISAGLPLDVALKYDVQLCRLTNYVRDKALEELKKGPVGELVLVHRKVLNKLGIDDEVINTVAHTPAQQEPVATEHPLVAYAESYEQIARSGSSGKVSAPHQSRSRWRITKMLHIRFTYKQDATTQKIASVVSMNGATRHGAPTRFTILTFHTYVPTTPHQYQQKPSEPRRLRKRRSLRMTCDSDAVGRQRPLPMVSGG